MILHKGSIVKEKDGIHIKNGIVIKDIELPCFNKNDKKSALLKYSNMILGYNDIDIFVCANNVKFIDMLDLNN